MFAYCRLSKRVKWSVLGVYSLAFLLNRQPVTSDPMIKLWQVWIIKSSSSCKDFAWGSFRIENSKRRRTFHSRQTGSPTKNSVAKHLTFGMSYFIRLRRLITVNTASNYLSFIFIFRSFQLPGNSQSRMVSERELSSFFKLIVSCHLFVLFFYRVSSNSVSMLR